MAVAMGVLTETVGVTSKIYGRAKISTYAIVTSMPPARDCIWGRLDDIWYASLGMSKSTRLYSKSTWYSDNASSSVIYNYSTQLSHTHTLYT